MTQWKILGKTFLNNSISAAYLGNKGKTVLIMGCMHGDEKQGKPISFKILEYYENNHSLLNNKSLVILPVVNPDGYAIDTRGNSNKVDLNRNFPTKNWEHSPPDSEFYSGQFAGSECETKIIINFLESTRPDLIISFHQPFKLINYDGPAEKYASILSKYSNYKLENYIGYPTPGSFGTYAGIERNIPTITVELPENEPDEKVWRDISHGTIMAINSL